MLLLYYYQIKIMFLCRLIHWKPIYLVKSHLFGEWLCIWWMSTHSTKSHLFGEYTCTMNIYVFDECPCYKYLLIRQMSVCGDSPLIWREPTYLANAHVYDVCPPIRWQTTHSVSTFIFSECPTQLYVLLSFLVLSSPNNIY